MVFSIALVICLSFLFGTLLLGLVAKLYYQLWSKKHSCSVKVSNFQAQTDVVNLHEQDLEVGGDDEKNLQQMKNCCDEGGVDLELMRLHQLRGPPRFLFTIKEETEEDLETKSFDDSCNVRNFNHLFESSVDEEISMVRYSPPSKFKFLRDADEKWERKLMEQV